MTDGARLWAWDVLGGTARRQQAGAATQPKTTNACASLGNNRMSANPSHFVLAREKGTNRYDPADQLPICETVGHGNVTL